VESRARAALAVALCAALASRLWNALEAPVLRGYDAWGHVAYVLFLDLYRAVPYADQGWSYFHPPLHYALGFLMAQADSAVVLVRGLLLLSSAASLGIAVLAARLVATALPGQPWLSPVALVAVAFLPVHVYTSTMPGNEQTAAFLASLALVAFLRNERRAAPTRRGDALAGVLAGLALLAKFSGLLALAAIAATLALRALREESRGRGLARATRRSALLCGCALLVCGPYYARNVWEFGDPFQMSRDYALVEGVEAGHPPGSRSWRDFVSLSPRLLTQPDPVAEHLLHSVWGSVYLSTWLETQPGGPLQRGWPERWLPWLGLLPTGLFVAGLALSLRRALRSRDAVVELAMVLLTALNLAAFAGMAWRIPIHPLLKSSYLLQLSLPYGFFLALALAQLAARASRPAAGAAAAGIAAAALASAVAWLPQRIPTRPENARMARVHAYFGDTGRAVGILEAEQSPYPARRLLLLETRAAFLLEGGRAGDARQAWSDALAAKRPPSHHLEKRGSPWLAGRWAVAAALEGHIDAAARRLDAALAREPLPELLVSRAALRARVGALAGAESDLRRALAAAPDLAAAWINLAWVLGRRGDAQAAERASREAARLARRAPRGFPYGIGDGFHLNDQRYLLVLAGEELGLYRPARARGAPAWPEPRELQ
jgi:tetratricopeptide (TPR) repeat protein